MPKAQDISQHKDIKNIREIVIKSARVHNLKNISLRIPRDKFIVITGLSGSGKSSLAFDTLYAEGQRRYVESLSSYARQFLGRIHKPEVDYIKGIPPAIAIEQKVNTRNPRSTVGTSTEIYDYLKLLFARIGVTYSPISGKLVKRHTVTDVVDYLLTFPDATRAIIIATPKIPRNRKLEQHLETLVQQGYSRVEIITKTKDKKNEAIIKVKDLLNDKKLLKKVKTINIVIDRITVRNDEDTQSRIADSVQTAFYEGHGECMVKVFENEKTDKTTFSSKFEADGIVFEEPTVHTFSFNNPVGACPRCEGFGKIMGIDENLVVPDQSLSVYEDAIAAWRGEKMKWWKIRFIQQADTTGFPIHRPYNELSDEHKAMLWEGTKQAKGLNSFFTMLEKDSYKIQYRVMLSRYRGKTICPDCKGTRLKKEAGYVKVGGKSIHELVLMPVSRLTEFFNNLELDEQKEKIARRLLIEIRNRLKFLCNVGLGYLTLNRLSSTLSGGESQRINLATSLGSSLVGSLYILDEPSIGLHPRDNHLLIGVLKDLQKLGNTVIVVEHDEEIIRAADQIIDIGPFAGRLGGEIVFQGTINELKKNPKSLTNQYLIGKKKIDKPQIRRNWNHSIDIFKAQENNLKSIDVKFPLNVFTVITGVSGSGKSTLVRNILYAELQKRLNGYSEYVGKFKKITGDIKRVQNIEFVDQNPIGRSSRSNPVTYIKAYDEIRKLFSLQQAAKINGFKPSHFSFNIDGGRCEECQGEGTIQVEMQFMADVHLVCESCNGKRFKDEILEVKYKEKNIYDVLEMTIEEAVEFFGAQNNKINRKIVDKLRLLTDVGLGYVKLGQSSSTLSGGESQRIKLASFLGSEKPGKHNLFIFDEPTTGLHFHDIKKLLNAFNALLDKGHSIVVIEHNLEIIKSADWIIDLGPEGGENGGEVIFEGTPEDLVNCTKSYTAKFLQKKI